VVQVFEDREFDRIRHEKTRVYARKVKAKRFDGRGETGIAQVRDQFAEAQPPSGHTNGSRFPFCNLTSYLGPPVLPLTYGATLL
jgi:hypothetical protein